MLRYQNRNARFFFIDKPNLCIVEYCCVCVCVRECPLANLFGTVPHAGQQVDLLQLFLPLLLLHPPTLLLGDDVVPAPMVALRIHDDLLLLHHGEVGHLAGRCQS